MGYRQELHAAPKTCPPPSFRRAYYRFACMGACACTQSHTISQRGHHSMTSLAPPRPTMCMQQESTPGGTRTSGSCPGAGSAGSARCERRSRPGPSEELPTSLPAARWSAHPRPAQSYSPDHQAYRRGSKAWVGGFQTEDTRGRTRNSHPTPFGSPTTAQTSLIPRTTNSMQ